MASEQEMLARLHRARLETVRDYYHRPTTLLAPPPSIGRAGWVDFLAITAPTLRAHSWRLEIDTAFPWRLQDQASDWSQRFADRGSLYEGGVQISGSDRRCWGQGVVR